ncbi:inositol monophosphatase [bacterium]|nr:inositol monophosphatase [bacterium]
MKPTESEARELLEAIEAMCRRAGAIQMKHFRQLDGYEKKGAIDLLTIADKESEAAIAEEIQQRFPNHALLAEEGGTSGAANSDYLWVVDPLDGTTNYAHGMPIFAVSIALQFEGGTIAGGVFAPALGDLYLAARGHGATRNGKPIHVSKVDQLDDALLVTGFPYDRRKHLDWLMGTMGSFLQQSQGMLRLGAAALDLAAVASGQLEGFYEKGLHPWDMAAGALMVEEAGGRMSDFEGGPFDIHCKRMLASNGRVHDAMMRVLAERTLDD